MCQPPPSRPLLSLSICFCFSARFARCACAETCTGSPHHGSLFLLLATHRTHIIRLLTAVSVRQLVRDRMGPADAHGSVAGPDTRHSTHTSSRSRSPPTASKHPRHSVVRPVDHGRPHCRQRSSWQPPGLVAATLLLALAIPYRHVHAGTCRGRYIVSANVGGNITDGDGDYSPFQECEWLVQGETPTNTINRHATV